MSVQDGLRLVSGCRLGEMTEDVPPRHPGPGAPQCPRRRVCVFRWVAGGLGLEQGVQEGGGLGSPAGGRGAGRAASVLPSPGLRPERAPASCAALQGPGRPASVLPT